MNPQKITQTIREFAESFVDDFCFSEHFKDFSLMCDTIKSSGTATLRS